MGKSSKYKTHKQRRKSKSKGNKKNNKTIKSVTLKRNKLTKAKCSPQSALTNQYTFSCYTTNQLKTLKKHYNITHPNNKITATNTKQIWNELNNNLAKQCDNETCWYKQLNLHQNEYKEQFAPNHPISWNKNTTEWLSNIDIMKVMKQYEKAYHCFQFLGPSSIDYDTVLNQNNNNNNNTNNLSTDYVCNELMNFNLENLCKNKKYKIGIIFNLDNHLGKGTHWVSLFINCHTLTIYYFDSVGNKIPKQINKFVSKVQEQGNKMNLSFKFDQNYPVQHQYSDTECGMYSLFFIINMLQDNLSNAYLKTHKLSDKLMIAHRNIMFNSPNN